jgi:hypothetical protein
MEQKLTVVADHYQFYLEDLTVPHDTASLWSEQEHDNRVAVLPGLIAVATARYGGDLPVTVVLEAAAPADRDFDGWDHVVECSLVVQGRRLSLTSPEVFGAEAPGLDLSPGTYRARIYYAGLDTIRGGADLEGEDHYRIVLWPAPATPPTLLKCKPCTATAETEVE